LFRFDQHRQTDTKRRGQEQWQQRMDNFRCDIQNMLTNSNAQTVRVSLAIRLRDI
jgi:hypothetical protein